MKMKTKMKRKKKKKMKMKKMFKKNMRKQCNGITDNGRGVAWN